MIRTSDIERITEGMKNAVTKIVWGVILIALALWILLVMIGNYKAAPVWRTTAALLFFAFNVAGWSMFILNIVVLHELFTLRYKLTDEAAPLTEDKPVGRPQRLSSGYVEPEAELQEDVPARRGYLLEVRVGQQIRRLPGYEYTVVEWGILYDQLRASQWRWSKKILGKTGLFVVGKIGRSLTAGSTYEDITSDFREVGAVEGDKGSRRVTREGRAAFQAAAGRSVRG